MENKLKIFTSFKGNEERFPIYDLNYKSFSKNIPANLDLYINDSSEEHLQVKNEKIFTKNFKNKLFYFKNNLNLLESWIFLLKQINSKYVFSIFDDQYLFNLKESTINNIVDFLEKEHMDVFLFLYFETKNFDDVNNIINIQNSETERIRKHKIKDVLINGQKFALINNDSAQFKYNFFLNNAIYKKDFLLQQLEYFNSFFKGINSAHMSEMNHYLCPENLKNKIIGICVDDEVAHIDLDYKHIVGIRKETEEAFANFCSINKNYKINII